MNWFYIRLIILVVSTANGQQDQHLYYPDSPSITMEWLFENNSTVLSGEVVSIDSNTALLGNLELYKGQVVLDSYAITWSEGFSGDFSVNDRILVFADSLGNIDPRFGVHYPGIYLMDVIFNENLHNGWPSRIARAVTFAVPEEWLYQISEGNLVENGFIPIHATLNFPLSGESVELSIVQSGDSICTLSSYSVLDSNQVTDCFLAPRGRISFYGRVKKFRNFVRNGVAFQDGYDYSYERDTLFVSYNSAHWRTLEEFLDQAAFGNVQEYNIWVDTDYDFSRLGLEEPLSFYKSPGRYIRLRANNPMELSLCQTPPEIVNFSKGFFCFELPGLDSLETEDLICFRYADSLETSNYDIIYLMDFIAQESSRGEIYLYNSNDSTLVFLDDFSCDVEPYDISISNKEPRALATHEYLEQENYGSKPMYFLSEIGKPVFLTLNYSEQVLSDTTYTYAWLIDSDGGVIHPTEIIEGTVDDINYYCSKFTYRFDIPESVQGKLLIDIRSMDLAKSFGWWSYGRSYWGILDVFDSTDCHQDKRVIE